jgi:two-component system response regulator AtoC
MSRKPPDDEGTTSLSFADEPGGRPLAVAFYEGRFVAQELPDSGQLTIGRGKESDIRIDHRSVSRRHAALHVGPPLTVEDLGSSNGTRLSGRRLEPHRREALPIGSIVEIGVATLIVRGSTLPANTASPAQSNAVARPEPAPDGGTTMQRLRSLAPAVARGDISVILLGETGVGKEVMAELIHSCSARRSKPLVRINCAALPEALLESELFGYERGAFSGAAQAKAGLLEAAHEGTLLLDEVAELALPTQAKLLRVLEGHEVTRLGAVRPRVVDVRFLAATNRDLGALVERGAFRRDLFHRLNGITLAIPPLRERLDEIEDLATHFVAMKSEKMGWAPAPLLPASRIWLKRQEWLGNIRELRNVVERAVVLSAGAPIGVGHLDDPLGTGDRPQSHAPPSRPLQDELDAIERARIEQALLEVGGNQTKAAALLGVSRRTLIGRLDAYGLPRPRKTQG